MTNEKKCAVIGCGRLGRTIAYTYAVNGLFSEILLIDKDMRRAQGEALDIERCVPFLSSMRIYAGGYADIADASFVVIAADADGDARKNRMARLSENLRMTESIVTQIVRYNREAVLLIASSPVDILTYHALKVSGFPQTRVIGTGTVLDTACFRQKLGEALSVDRHDVHAYIIGEHGQSEFPVFSTANVSGMRLEDFCRASAYCNGMQTVRRIFEEVRDSHFRIMEAKGASYFAEAQAVLCITRSIVQDENAALTVSCLLDSYDGKSPMCLGMPAILGRCGIKQILTLPLTEEETRKLHESAVLCNQEYESASSAFV